MSASVTPRRRQLKPTLWLASDRAAWAALFAKGDVLAGDDALGEDGPGRHWAPATRETYRRSYGRWLGWLAAGGALDPDLSPGGRATPEAVRGFVEALRGQVTSKSVVSCLANLKAVLKAMHPETDWRGLDGLCARLNAWAEPSVDRGAALRPIEEIHAASQRELDRLAATPLKGRNARVAFRDALIVLLLSAAPVRLRNLAAIEIGRHLVQSGDRWWLRFPAAETKTRQPLAFELPRHLDPYLAVYLERVRPALEPELGERRLWIAFGGQKLAAGTVYIRVVRVTRRLFGTPINPHGFRACAATSFALRSPALARQAASLLGHRDFRTTETHYIKANQLEASRGVNAVLREMRGEQRKGKGREGRQGGRGAPGAGQG